MLDLDTTLPGNTEMSSVAELSSHVCESFLSPDNSLDWEQPVRRVFQSLDLAVDGLLGLALDSSRQVSHPGQKVRPSAHACCLRLWRRCDMMAG